MSKKKSSSSAPVPTAPKPQNEYYYNNGTLESSRVYDKGKGGYLTNSYSTPQEQAIEKNATQFISDLSARIPQEFQMTPEQLDAGVKSYTDPQMRALNESYNQAVGSATNAATSRGVRNSLGFNDYFAKQIERNRAQGSADIAAAGEQMRYQLPSMRLAPFVDAFNLVNAGLSGQQAQQRADLEPSFQGSQSASNYFGGLYPSQLNAWQLMNQPKPRSGGFSLFGG